MPHCSVCSKQVLPGELRMLIGDEEHAAFSDRQARSALTDSMYIPCVNDKCNNVMERLPAADAEARAAKDQKELCRLEYRMRCRECATIFCAHCRITPYHDNYTCEGYEQFAKSKHCRFCDEALSAATRSASQQQLDDDSDDDSVELDGEDLTTLLDVCDDQGCKEAAKSVCRRRHDCGHPCQGVRGERKCLRCLHW